MSREQHAYCLRCRTVAEEGETRCVACGARFNPLPFRGLVYAVLLVALVGALGVGVAGMFAAARDKGDEEAAQDARPPAPVTTAAPTTVPDTTPTTVALEPVPVVAVAIEASAVGGTSQNSCGEPTTYEPQKAQDGDPTTTWRVRGDGTGQTLQLTLAGPTRLTSVGLLPGFAKVDPCSGTDRFPQLRRVTSVRWVFDGGVAVDQTFADEPQIQSIPVDVTTGLVTVEITGVTASPDIDATPISEIALLGVPAGAASAVAPTAPATPAG
jgi:hypothetical protein